MAGGGVGEAALIGAALGGGASAISGRDPLQGALLGGLTGGITGGLMPGAEALSPEALAAGYSPSLAASTPLSEVAGLTQSIPNAAPSGLASLMPQSFAGKAALGGAGLGLMGMLGDRGKYGVPETEKYSGPLSKFQYDPSTYTPYTYRPYAGGGPVEAMSDANAVGANTGYPMADISRGAYATPYQQPISQNVISGAQDTRVDPFTGKSGLQAGAFLTSAAILMAVDCFAVLAMVCQIRFLP